MDCDQLVEKKENFKLFNHNVIDYVDVEEMYRNENFKRNYIWSWVVFIIILNVV